MKNFYIIGNPVNHSISPKVFNHIFKTLLIDGTYRAKHINSLQDLEKFINASRAYKDFEGANVTLPYKVNSVLYLDRISKAAKIINAVNCLSKKDGKIIGNNTDYSGFLDMCKRNKVDFKNKEVIILGSGGAARSVLYALSFYKKINNIYIYSRNRLATCDIMNNFKLLYNTNNLHDYHYVNHKKIKNVIIINCISLTYGNLKDGFIDDIPFNKVKLYIDTNYISTAIYKHFKKNKYCKTMKGLDMFIYQAIHTLEIWAGDKISKKISYSEISKILDSK